jgi:hypothetical protein
VQTDRILVRNLKCTCSASEMRQDLRWQKVVTDFICLQAMHRNLIADTPVIGVTGQASVAKALGYK